MTEHYDLPDRREDPAFRSWNEDLEKYESFVERQLKAQEEKTQSEKPAALTLPELPEQTLITREEYGDWIANRGVWLSAVNGTGVQNATEFAVDPAAAQISLKGWMADFRNDAPVKELYLQVGETILKCEYGGERKDVVERYGKEELRNCGFEVTFSAKLLGGEPCELSFYGVSADGKYLYEPVIYQLTFQNSQEKEKT